MQLLQHRALDPNGDRLDRLGAADLVNDQRPREFLCALVGSGETAQLQDLPGLHHGGHLTIGRSWSSPWTSAPRRRAPAHMPTTAVPCPAFIIGSRTSRA